MKKTPVKKLTLSRETLLELSSGEAAQAKGGIRTGTETTCCIHCQNT
jgi:hypothetical protein